MPVKKTETKTKKTSTKKVSKKTVKQVAEKTKKVTATKKAAKPTPKKAPSKKAATSAKTKKVSDTKKVAKTTAKKTPSKKTSPITKKTATPKTKKETAANIVAKNTAKKAPSKKVSTTAAKKTTPTKTTAQVSKKKPTKKTTTAGNKVKEMNIASYVEKKGEEYMNDGQKDHIKNILMAWKQSLMEEVDRTMSHLKDEAANFPDPSDRASQEEEFSLELRTRDRERKLIKKIEDALERLRDEEFGYCETCGIEIGLKRLEARPTATLCIDCKTLSEIKERQNIGG